MLLGKDGGGDQNRRLFAVHNGLHHRPESNFRFTKAHIAAQKPVHGNGGLHIVLDLSDTAELVIGFGVGEIVFKFRLPGRVCRKGKTRLMFSGGVKLDEFTGHIFCGFPGLGFGFLPGVGADLVQANCGVLTAADVFTDQIQLGCGNEERIAALVGNFDIVLDGIVHFDPLHGHKTANAVILVDHQIAGSQVGEGIQFLPVGGGLFGGFLFGFHLGHQLAFRQYRQLGIGVLHTVGQSTFCQQDLTGFGHGG